jgi:CheY-like chemotaxis protein
MSRQKKQTILVVDDEPLNLQVLSQALKGQKCEQGQPGEMNQKAQANPDPAHLGYDATSRSVRK